MKITISAQEMCDAIAKQAASHLKEDTTGWKAMVKVWQGQRGAEVTFIKPEPTNGSNGGSGDSQPAAEGAVTGDRAEPVVA